MTKMDEIKTALTEGTTFRCSIPPDILCPEGCLCSCSVIKNFTGSYTSLIFDITNGKTISKGSFEHVEDAVSFVMSQVKDYDCSFPERFQDEITPIISELEAIAGNNIDKGKAPIRYMLTEAIEAIMNDLF